MPVLDKTDLQNIAREVFGCSGTVWHVAKTGNDTTGDGLSWGTAYLTVAKAVSVMSAGDVVLVGRGLFDEGTTSLVFTDGMIVGQGWQTIIQGSNTAGSGAIFDVRGNCRFKNLKIQSNVVSNGTTFNYPIYFATDATTVTMDDCWINGITDCFYKPNGATTISAYVSDSLLTTNWDWIATRGGNQTFALTRCRCISTGPTGATGVQASTGMIFRGTSVNARFVQTYLEAGNDTYGNTLLSANAGTVHLVDSHMRVYGSGTLVNILANAASVIITGDSTYDPAYASTSNGGTITRVGPLHTTAGTTSIDLGGKVLGGGSGTISGVGANTNVVAVNGVGPVQTVALAGFIQAIVNDAPVDTNFSVTQYSAQGVQWTLYHSDGTPYNLSGKTVNFRVANRDGTTRISYGPGNIAISGTSNNIVTVTFSTTDTPTAISGLTYTLWDVTVPANETPLARGQVSIIPAANPA